MSAHPFRVTYYGVRGSIPTPARSQDIEEKMLALLEQVQPEDLVDEHSRRARIASLPVQVRGSIGGNSSCIYMEVGGHHLIFDAGSGIRLLGGDLFKRGFLGQGKAHLFFTHTHWDHILGLPFFGPIYVKGNHFTFYGVHEDLERRLRDQQDPRFFPIPFDYYASTIDFQTLKNRDAVILGDVKITWKEMDHPGASYTYAVEYAGKKVVFSTDSEYRSQDDAYLEPSVQFFRNADLLIFDAQYTMDECVKKEDWGHSSSFFGIQLALRAQVKQLAFTHHEPSYSDFKLHEILESSREFLAAIAPEASLRLELACEGVTVEL